MSPRTFVFITALALCHLSVRGQGVINALPPAQSVAIQDTSAPQGATKSLPEDPGQEALPVAQPEAAPATGEPDGPAATTGAAFDTVICRSMTGAALPAASVTLTRR